MYYDYNEQVCPICGSKIKHPYTGLVTPEQLEEDEKSCIWIEVVDEGRGTIGYSPICRNKGKRNE